ncbi:MULTISPECIES: class I SAM-dependent methyltransferase [Nocardia]|uniref:Methyltransferase family protein n=2 Tax=Nocardia TaxID=1817 RepID=A0A4R6PWS2_NOCIG|nr:MULTISPECIES: methyltransferase domain-containing protein [Nocardia]NKX87563.1 methyltransferase domain-containing protein [Nocardia coubleae]TDP43072.1 methyltransferase family protein [Nocardia ignorata]
MKFAERYDIAAPIYDRTAWFLSLGGIDKLHPGLVEGLDLTGKKVADLGCGTGLAFPALLSAVGPTGHVIGVDNNAAILAKAQKRVEENHWPNVTLLTEDIAELPVNQDVDVLFSCIAFSCVPHPSDKLAELLGNLTPGTQVRIIDALPRTSGLSRYPINGYNFVKSGIVGSHFRELHPFEQVFRDRLTDVVVDYLHGGMYTRLTGVKGA